MRVHKLNVQSFLVLIILINPLLSLIFDNTKIYYHYFMYPLILFLVLISEKRQGKLFKISFLFCVLIAFCTVFALLSGSQIGKVHNHLFSYMDAVLLMLYSTSKANLSYVDDEIKKRIKLISLIALVINVVEFLMIVTNRGYVYIYSWRGNFFQGTNSMPHTLSYLMLATIIYVLILVIYTKKKIYSLLAIIPSYCVFISGARVSLLLAAALIVILLSIILTAKQKNVVLKIAKILPLVLIFFFVFKNKIFSSDLMTKIRARSASGNATAGRTYIWRNIIDNYLTKSNFLQYLFGQGDDKSYMYNLNNTLVGVEVWAHNDFVQILIGKGIVGIVVYLFSIINFIKSMFKKNGNIYTWTIVGFILAAALLNGFYSYRDVNLCIPLLMLINDKLTYKMNGMETLRGKSKLFNYSTGL